MKERKFVKEAFEKAEREIKVSTIEILESSENKEGEIESVTFLDRFKNKCEVYMTTSGDVYIEGDFAFHKFDKIKNK